MIIREKLVVGKGKNTFASVEMIFSLKKMCLLYEKIVDMGRELASK